jgi:hypothetical protein
MIDTSVNDKYITYCLCYVDIFEYNITLSKYGMHNSILINHYTDLNDSASSKSYVLVNASKLEAT